MPPTVTAPEPLPTRAVTPMQRLRIGVTKLPTLVRRVLRRVRAAFGAAERIGCSGHPDRTGPAGVVPAVATHLPGRRSSRWLARALPAAVAVLMAAASAAGLWWQGLYRDPEPIVAMLQGYDQVSLAVALPVLVAAQYRAHRGSARGELITAGVLAYAFYHYAFFVLGTTFNALFLVHLAAFVMSGLALVLRLQALDVDDIAARFRARTPVRWISAVLALLALSLGGMWTYYSIRFAITSATPGESRLVLPVTAVHLGYVLDLTLLVPTYAASAALLWKRAPWGFVSAAVLLISTGLSQIDYMAALLFQAAARVPGATAFDPAEPVIAGTVLTAATALLVNLRREESRTAPGIEETRLP